MNVWSFHLFLVVAVVVTFVGAVVDAGCLGKVVVVVVGSVVHPAT